MGTERLTKPSGCSAGNKDQQQLEASGAFHSCPMVFVGGELSDQTGCPAPNLNIGRVAFPAVPAYTRTSCGQGVGKTSLSSRLLNPQVWDNGAVGQGARQRGQGTGATADGRSLVQYRNSGAKLHSLSFTELAQGHQEKWKGAWERGARHHG